MRTFWIVAPVGVAVSGAMAAANPAIAVAMLAGATVLSLIARSMNHAAVALLLMAVPFMRPFILGERYAVVSIALALAAAGVAAAADRHRGERLDRGSGALATWLSVQWVWLLALPAIHPTMPLTDLAKGVAQVPLVLVAALIVLRDPVRWRLAARWAAIAVTVACSSYVVTLGCWLALGSGSMLIGPIPASYPDWSVNLYAPFTPATSGGFIGNVYIPRFLGLGREPGVMAALVAWSVFTANQLGFRRRWLLVLLLGLLGTQSTAGFGVILMIWVLTTFLVIPERHLGTLAGFARQVAGLWLVAIAAYLAWFAPTFGVEAKRDQNPLSYEDRMSGTLDGLQALVTRPFGLPPEEITASTPGVNIVAATSIVGTIGTALVLICLFRPLALSGDARAAAPGVLVTVATVATAQPLIHSAGFYLLIAISLSMTSQTIKRTTEGSRTSSSPSLRRQSYDASRCT
jgi:hypothetical protein